MRLLCFAILIMASTGVTAGAAEPFEPIAIAPHPQLGSFTPSRDHDRPIIACYGGIGLHDLGGGEWTGYGIRNRADVDLLMDRCRRFGIGRICASFLEQWPSLAVTAPPPQGHDDLLAYAVEAAHAAGVEIYADLPVFAVFGELDKPFAKAHPEFLTRDVDGVATPHMLSAAWPEVRRYKRTIIMEMLSKFPVDGVQLDFIRWPYYGRDLLKGVCVHGYDEPLLRTLRAKHGLPVDFRPEPGDPRFLQARQECITQFIRELREDMRASGIALPIGVYNSNAFGRTCSLHDVCQDWQTWDAEGLVDEHHPMFYFDSLTRLTRAVDSLTSIKRHDSIVFGPLFLCEVLPPDRGPDTLANRCREAARRMIKQGCDGLWFCRAAEIEKHSLWPVVDELSRISLSATREQSFDPLYENLVTNGSFEDDVDGWSLPIGTTVVKNRPFQGLAALRISLSDQSAVVAQRLAERYASSEVVDARSLAFSFAYRCIDVSAPRKPEVVLKLVYSDAGEETRRFALDGTRRNWTVVEERFRTDRRPSHRGLDSTLVQVMIPPGSGQIWLDRFELLHDPLDNPLFPGESEVR